MPSQLSAQTRPISPPAFKAIDYTIMAEAFSIHNELGPLLDEKIYQEALKRKCESQGLEALRETEIKVSHKSFSKSYYIDLLKSETSNLRPVEFYFNNLIVGQQNEYLLNDATALRLTSLKSSLKSYHKNLTRCLHHTKLSSIQ